MNKHISLLITYELTCKYGRHSHFTLNNLSLRVLGVCICTYLAHKEEDVHNPRHPNISMHILHTVLYTLR